MLRPFYLLLPMAALLVSLPAAAEAAEDSVEAGEGCPVPMGEAWSGTEELREAGERDHALYQVEELVWLHMKEEMWWHHGVLVFADLPGRELVPVWFERPREVEPGRFEVPVEMTAVTAAPSDFPEVGEAGRPPRLIPRTTEQAVMFEARVRGPTSWRITYEVLEIADEAYEVVGWRVTGRPGEKRPPLRLCD